MERIGVLLSVGASWSVAPFSGQAPDEELRITAIHDPPYIGVYPQPDGSYRYDGYLYDLWQIVAASLHLRYKIVPLLTGGYGSKDANGTWLGMVGELAYRRADIALTWISIRKDRATVVDYLDAVPVDHDKYTFHVRQGSGSFPQIGPSMFDSLLKPLHVDVWWALLVSLLVLSVVLRVSLRFNHERAESRGAVKDMTWGSCLLSSFMTLVGQGWASTPHSLAARTVVISSWLLGILIYVNYTANLISHLTVFTVDRPISSLREFSEQPGWILATEPALGISNDWERSSDKYERELFHRIASRKRFIELNLTGESGRRVLDHRVMSYIDINRLFYTFGADACDLIPLQEKTLRRKDNCMVIGKGRNRLRKAINYVMQKMQEVGIVSRLKNYWLRFGQDKCSTSKGFKSLSIGDLLAVLILTPLAVASSSAVLLAECLWSRMHTEQNNRQRVWAAPAHRKTPAVIKSKVELLQQLCSDTEV